MSRKFTQFDVTSRDVTIIRQHFCNDELINYLWKGPGNLEDRVKEVDKWLGKMVEMTLRVLTDEEIAQIESVYKSPAILAHEKIQNDFEQRAREKKVTEEIPF